MLISEPLVTVLVPSYNHESFIEERIKSILKQTYRSFELIVIDDNSPDKSHQKIIGLRKLHKFRYIKNRKNKGTFSSWGEICKLARGKYLWICESDDLAYPNFLEEAVKRLESKTSASIFYCNSEVINDQGECIGTTLDYFHNIWKSKRWDNNFSAKGIDELNKFQIKGQTVPNMSSALLRFDDFTKAYSPFLRKFRNTGDWLLIGKLLKFGDVEFHSGILSKFRKHSNTTTKKIESATSQAEFIHTKFILFKLSSIKREKFLEIFSNDVVRFLYENATPKMLFNKMMKISFANSLQIFIITIFYLIKNPSYLKKFHKKYSEVKEYKRNISKQNRNKQ